MKPYAETTGLLSSISKYSLPSAGSKSAKSPIITPLESYSSDSLSACSSADAGDKIGVKKEITIMPIKNIDFVERFSDMLETQLNATLHSN